MKNSENHTLVLAQNDIHSILKTYGLNTVMDDLISALEKAVKNFNPAKTTIPARSGFNYTKPHTGLIEWMPVFDHTNQVVIKVVGYHPDNPKVNSIPTIVSTISSYDTSSGHLKVIVDGILLTALRTGATSAIASKYLADPESATLGLIGCGAQSVTQLHALSRIFDIRQILVYDIDPIAMYSFKDRVSIFNSEFNIILSTIPEIIASSDIVCTATSIDVGAGPLFKNLKSKESLHINAVGSDFPGKTEIPVDFLKNSFVCPDFLDQAIVEGECQQLNKEDIDAPLVKVLQDSEKYRAIRYQPSVFDSTGWALEDQVVIDLFTDYALKLGLGSFIEIEYMPEDAKNPYHFMSKVNTSTQV